MLACLVNGEISAFVPADDRGLAYGDGLFETLVVQAGRPRFWQLHMDRLGKGCTRLGFEIPPQEVLLREVQTVAAGQPRCVVKIILTRGSGGRGYAPPAPANPVRVISAHAFPADLEKQATVGVEVQTCEIKLAFQPALGGMKHLNRLEQVLGAQEMAAKPGVEGLLRDQEDFLNSTLSGNLFLVSEGRLLTPRADRCGVHGVVRALILRDCKSWVELRRVHRNLLTEVDEVFMTNAVRGVVPIIRIDDREWPVGSVTRGMQDWFRTLCESE